MIAPRTLDERRQQRQQPEQQQRALTAAYASAIALRPCERSNTTASREAAATRVRVSQSPATSARMQRQPAIAAAAQRYGACVRYHQRLRTRANTIARVTP